jgi:hypothetical protein
VTKKHGGKGPLGRGGTLSPQRRLPTTDVTKLIYIGGYGHSGSTLLEYLLAASPEIVACGEVSSVLHQRGRKEKCTCGKPAAACPVWGPVAAGSRGA